jgi:DNA-binding SARP family transcriptional activator
MTATFRLIGEIEVRVNGRPVDAGHARQLCVLAVLLTEANRAVSPAQLIDRVWGRRPLPADPVKALQTYISLLRRATAGAENVSITRQSTGYKISVETDAIDLHLFRGLVGRARECADDDRAADLFQHALRLWRGDPFAHLDTPWINSVRDMLVSQRHDARLDLFDVQLRRGQHSALVAELSRLAAEHPFDERAAGQLMTALYRCGRPADALAHYRKVCRHLADELGTGPGPLLRRLNQEIVAGDAALAVAPRGLRAARLRGPAVPRELPGTVTHFVGRQEELAALTKLADQAGQQLPGTAVVAAIDGAAGVGKTALAVHWAHQAAARFPDGQLYANLRGADPAGPLQAGDVLAAFLRSMGMPSRGIPQGTDERAARYRSLLSGRRMLVALDNARLVDHVRPLLPATPACMVVVTSRDALAGLVARDGARRLHLDVLPPADAANLLRALIGRRADADPAALAALAEHCTRLPLALRVTAELAAARPGIPLAELACELTSRRPQLDRAV